MRVLLLADAYSSHTIKWANSLAENGLEVYLYSLSPYDAKFYNDRVKIYQGRNYRVNNFEEGSYFKIIYLSSYFNLKELIEKIKPDILHAHYASSYGFLGSIMNYHPLIISAWGSDITEFPNKSGLHKLILKKILKKADAITATSKFLEKELNIYTKRKISVVPFGIDVNRFKRMDSIPKNEDTIFIGIFKSLEKHYGIDLLLKAFSKAKSAVKFKLKLLIVGSGSLESELKKLTEKLNLSGSVDFTGRIDHNIIERYHNMVDIAAYPSVSDSFGVAVLESSACEKPVIVSDTEGLTETVINNKTGIIVPSGNIDALADALCKLIMSPSLRKQFGWEGRQFVKNSYDWNRNVEQMIKIYQGQI